MATPTVAWDFALAPFAGPSDLVAVAWADGARVLAYSARGEVLQCSLATGAFAHVAASPTPQPNGWRSLAVSPDGARVALGRVDGPARVLEGPALREREVPAPGLAHSVAFSPDGQRLLVGGMRTVTEVDLSKRKAAARKLPAHAHVVSAVGYLREGAVAVSADPHSVKLHDLAKGKSAALPGASAVQALHRRLVPGTTSLLFVGAELVLWDLLEDAERARWPLPGAPSPWFLGVDARGPTAAFTSEGELYLVDLATGVVRHGPLGTRTARGAAFSPDGALLALADNNSLRVLELATLRAKHAPEHYGAPVKSLAFTASPPRLWSACARGEVYAHAAQDGALVGRAALASEPNALCPRADGAPPRVLARERAHYALFEADSGALVARVPLRKDTNGTWWMDPSQETLTAYFRGSELSRVRWSDGAEELLYAPPGKSLGGDLQGTPDGARLLRAGLDFLDVWRTAEGTLEATHALATRGWGRASACTPEGAHFVCVSKKDVLVLFDLAKGRAAGKLTPPEALETSYGCTALAMDPRGRFVVASYRVPAGALLCCWDLAKRTLCAQLPWELPDLAYPTALALDREGARLAAGSTLGTLRCWDLRGMLP